MRKKIENILFESHPFLGPMMVIWVLAIPWWIAYWPGTLQYDSCGQLLQYLGVGKMTGHHPLPVTMLMGGLLEIGRAFFHSDNVGIFLYNGIQFVAQSMVLSYAFCVYRHIGVPMWGRWCSLIFFALFPLLPNWGISYGKDTGYYISFVLFILVIIHVFLRGKGAPKPWQTGLWMISLLGLVAFRNDGRYIAAVTAVVLLITCKKYWKTILLGLGTALAFLVLVEGIYMPLRNIPSGSVREALSVPLMQTANYIGRYGEEVTEEEEDILLSVFEVEDLAVVSEAYDPEISDNVKGLFKEYPEKDELVAYFKVWWQQLWKHPGSYVQTYLDHCDGYINPVKSCYEDIIGWFKILDAQSRTDEYLNIYFGMNTRGLRDALENWAYRLYSLPVLGWLFHTGTYTWAMLGCMIYLLCKGRKRDAIVIVPGLVVLLVCTVSPLNASVRYYLPVMAVMPVYISFCAAKSNKGKVE